jgi:spore germination protein GerM
MKKMAVIALLVFLPVGAGAADLSTLQSSSMGVTLFFEMNGVLVQEVAKVPRDKMVENEMKSVIDLLAAGSAASGPVVPNKARLETVFLGSGRTAYLNFNENFVTDHPGGITQEILTVAGVCQTVFANFDVDGIRFLVKGSELKTIAGHVDIESVISRPQCDRLSQYRRE